MPLNREVDYGQFRQEVNLTKKTKRFTQGELAEILGLSRYAYSRYENNQKKPSFDTIKNLLRFMGQC